MFVRLVVKQHQRASSFRRFYGEVGRHHVERCLKDNNALVIDVRELDEILASGALDVDGNTARTIPLPELEVALQMLEDDFLEQYQFPKPKHHEDIIFSCRSGKRSAFASLIAEKHGYKRVFNYPGGAMEWFS